MEKKEGECWELKFSYNMFDIVLFINIKKWKLWGYEITMYLDEGTAITKV